MSLKFKMKTFSSVILVKFFLYCSSPCFCSLLFFFPEPEGWCLGCKKEYSPFPFLSHWFPFYSFLFFFFFWGDIVLLAKPVTLTEGDRVTLTTDVPVATDGTSKPEKLLYAVSVPPVHGQIEHINYPGVPIPRHSRLDVVAQKVPSIHDNSHEAGKEPLRWADLPLARWCARKPSASKRVKLAFPVQYLMTSCVRDRCKQEHNVILSLQ